MVYRVSWAKTNGETSRIAAAMVAYRVGFSGVAGPAGHTQGDPDISGHTQGDPEISDCDERPPPAEADGGLHVGLTRTGETGPAAGRLPTHPVDAPVPVLPRDPSTCRKRVRSICQGTNLDGRDR